MNRRGVSLDTNTKRTGVVRWQGSDIVSHGFIQAKNREHMTLEIFKKLDYIKPDWVAVENVYHGHNAATTIILSKLLGAVEAWCWENGVMCLVFATATIDASVGIKAKSRKERKAQLKALARYELGNEITQDEADAYALGLCAIGKIKEENWLREAGD